MMTATTATTTHPNHNNSNTIYRSCGSLGFLTKLKVRVAPIKKYVHMTYEITNSPAELCQRMTELSESAACHFLEATLFTKVRGCVSGWIVASPSLPFHHPFTRFTFLIRTRQYCKWVTLRISPQV